MEPQIQILHTRGFAEILAIVRFRIVNSYPRFSGSMTRHNFKPCCDDKQFLAADATETPADSSPPERNFALAVLRSILAQPSRSVCLNCKVLVGIFAALMLCTGLECFGRRLTVSGSCSVPGQSSDQPKALLNKLPGLQSIMGMR
jgi:hypothetical protein